MNLLVAGDFCPQFRVNDSFEENDYCSVLEEIRKITKRVDYSLVNFECTIAKNDNSCIPKNGPNLRCSDKGIKALKWAGFNGVTLANNHFYDYGFEGVNNVLRICNENKIDTVGGGRDKTEASQILYKIIKGQRLAIINCCEHEFSAASTHKAGSNLLNPIRQYYSIKEAKNKSDFVVVIIHGGHENYNLPSPRMQELYRFFIDVGADVVINHHQHCYSGFEKYKGRLIFYGLGNFCFDSIAIKERSWYEGYMVELFLGMNSIDFKIIPYYQCLSAGRIEVLPEGSFNDRLSELNTIINNPSKIEDAISNYYQSSSKEVYCVLEPQINRIVNALQRRGWLPSLVRKKWLLRLQNYILCESHRDKMEFYFKMK